MLLTDGPAVKAGVMTYHVSAEARQAWIAAFNDDLGQRLLLPFERVDGTKPPQRAIRLLEAALSRLSSVDGWCGGPRSRRWHHGRGIATPTARQTPAGVGGCSKRTG